MPDKLLFFELTRLIKLYSNIVVIFPLGEAEIILWSDPVTTVYESSTTLLVCVATGYPYPQMSWLKNGTQLTNATDDVTIYVTGIEESGVSVVQSVLEVCGVRGEEVYTCVATNSEGEDLMTFDLVGGVLYICYVFTFSLLSEHDFRGFGGVLHFHFNL